GQGGVRELFLRCPVRGEERPPKLRLDAAQRQEHPTLPGAPGARHRDPQRPGRAHLLHVRRQILIEENSTCAPRLLRWHSSSLSSLPNAARPFASGGLPDGTAAARYWWISRATPIDRCRLARR